MEKLRKYLSQRGNISHLAREVGVTPGAVWLWRRKLPAERVLEVARITGIPRHDLRPDLYPKRLKA